MFYLKHVNMDIIVIQPDQLKMLLIESISIALKHHQPSTLPLSSDSNPYGDFKWLASTCSGVPASTLRIKSAAGEIPGVVKFGKRVLYEKAIVLNWLRSQTRQSPLNLAEIEQAADEQVSRQLAKKGGKAS
jgi:hypothetical protein